LKKPQNTTRQLEAQEPSLPQIRGVVEMVAMPQKYGIETLVQIHGTAMHYAAKITLTMPQIYGTYLLLPQ
jgi:hypothetical protein